MPRSRRSATVVACALLVGSCGGEDADTQPNAPIVSAPVTTEVAAAPVTPAPTTAPVITTTVAAATTVTSATTVTASSTAGVVNADPVLVDLDHFMIITDTTIYRAGTINFKVTNTSDTPHEFGIARGNSYEELPQLPDGSIDEIALGDDYLGKTAIVDQVLSPVREISFDLEPGNYVFFCNLVVGPVSHAARGQVLSVTVVA